MKQFIESLMDDDNNISKAAMIMIFAHHHFKYDNVMNSGEYHGGNNGYYLINWLGY